MKSLTWVANNYHISKTALHKRAKLISDFDKYRVHRGNRIFIKESGIKLITYQKHNSVAKFSHTRRGTKNHNVSKTALYKRIVEMSAINDDLVRDNHLLLNQLSTQPKLADKKIIKRIQDYNNHGPFYRFFHRLK